MTSMTTTAAGFELTAMMYATPAAPTAPARRTGTLTIKVATAGIALWLAATLGVLTGLWQAPLPAEVSGARAAEQAASR